MTDNMQIQASVNIDRKIGKTNAEMPAIEEAPKAEPKPLKQADFEPVKPKTRKRGTGCIYRVNQNLWEGSYYPKLPNGKRKKFNVYAKTREECEKLLAEMIKQKKSEISAEKERLKNKSKM